MFSKTQVFRISLIVSVMVIFEIPKNVTKLHMGVVAGATPDILPYRVIQQIRIAQNAHVPRRSLLKSAQGVDQVEKPIIFPATFYRDQLFSQSRGTSVNFRHYNSITPKRKPSTVRKQSLLGLSQQNIQLFHLYDDDGEHMLDLKVDKAESRPSEPRWPANAPQRRKSVLHPRQSSEGFKRIHHYWLYI